MNSTVDSVQSLPLGGREAGDGTPTESLRSRAELALERDKRESLDVAVKARLIALSVIALLIPFLNPTWEVIYYEVMLCGFALIGLAQRKIGRVGQSRAELVLMFCDLALLTVVAVAPNPFAAVDWPPAMQFRFDNFMYFYVLLAGATLAYSWRTVVAVGTWTSGLWVTGILLVWYFSGPGHDYSAELLALFGGNDRMAAILDPNSLQIEVRVQEIVVFLIVAVMLSQVVRRANKLLVGHAALERERANLARYFSPNVVEELSHNDEPLKKIRNQDIAVLFVDLVGFTAFASDRTPEEVITTLRSFHARMETEVFRHNGTLDKYLGDGLMATFGTPSPSATDTRNAMACARAMQVSVDSWNGEREAAGDPVIQASFGLHFGPVVLGDIGANRLEFAVIGNTVNVASRLEAMTRELGVTMVASAAVMERMTAEGADDDMASWTQVSHQTIRGVDQPITVWTLP